MDVSSVISSDGTVIAYDRSGPFARRRSSTPIVHTLAYDAAVVGDTVGGSPAPPELLGVTLRHAERQTLVEQPHEVAQDALAPALTEFLIRSGESTS
jgi:hypothetical protein